MTDYQPLLARALQGLGSNTSETRRAIYDRARQALLNQLRSASPPMADADITRERLALEDAIRRTETEAVRADPHAVRASHAPHTSAAPATTPTTAAKDAARPAPASAHPASAPASASVPASAAPSAATPVSSPVSAPASSFASPSAPLPKAAPASAAPVAAAPAAPAATAPETAPGAPRDPAPRNSTPRDPAPHGGAASHDAGSRGGASQSVSPHAGAAGTASSGPGAPGPRHAPPPATPRMPAARPAPSSRPAMPQPPTNGARPPAREAHGNERPPPRNGTRPVRDPNAPPVPGLARRFERARPPAQDPQAEISPDDFAPGRGRPPRGPAPRAGREAPASNTRGRMLVAGFIALLMVVAGSLGYMHRERIFGWVGGETATPQVADSQAPKSSERITPSPDAKPGQAAPAQTVDPAVAQRAVLYEENPGGGQQFQNFVGVAVWKTETVTLGAGRAPDLGLRVDIEIPDRHMSVVIKLRRNVDPSFPASHTIEVQFTTPNDPFGGVTDMRGMRAKSTETAQGTPLAAVVQKVKEGYFLLALPNIEEDSNLNMLRERDWLDVPLVYSNGRRAVLTFQKGTPGERAMNEAFLSWGKGN